MPEELRLVISESLVLSDHPVINETETRLHGKYSVDAPPGRIENRVFIGGNYALMPILRKIEEVVLNSNLRPIIAFDFDIPRDKTREYTIRLLYQCRYAIFEQTLPDGQIVELARASGLSETRILQLYMAMDEKREHPKTMSIMVWQTNPMPEGYLTIEELEFQIKLFLMRNRSEPHV